MKQDMYAFTTDALRVSGWMQPLKLLIGIIVMSTTPVSLAMQFHPLGPHDLTPRLVQIVLAVSAFVVGVIWIVGPWPTFRQSLWFVAWADVSLAIGTAMNSAPGSRICGAFNMGLIGVYIAFILGPRVLAAHCAFVSVLVLGLAAYSVTSDHVGWFDLYIYLAPLISSLIFLPALIQAVIEGARRAVHKVVQDANLDPLTGLNNRRGMYARADELIQRDASTVLAAVIIDLDRFKELNDEHGHDRGDLALNAVARVLESGIGEGDVAARLGGDEFGVVVARNSEADVAHFIDRLHAMLQGISDTVPASVGVVCRRLPVDDVDSILRHADRAMYEAKRQGGNRLIQFDPWGESGGSAGASDLRAAPLVRQQER